MNTEQPKSEIREGSPEYPDWFRRPDVITVEGELATGKDMVCEILCREYGYRYLEISAIGRGLAVAFTTEGIPREDEEAVGRFYREAKVELTEENGAPGVVVNGVDVTPRLRDADTYEMSSYLLRYPVVPGKVAETAQGIVREGNVVLNGRFLAREVWPGAELQLFLIGDFDTRLERRFRQLRAKDPGVSREEVERAMREREGKESAVGAHVASATGIIVDTTRLSVPETVIVAVETYGKRQFVSRSRKTLST
ncbi:MAG: (d)CMP kinase [bacterium]|nr:(d)CMP kinase [bacterium]